MPYPDTERRRRRRSAGPAFAATVALALSAAVAAGPAVARDGAEAGEPSVYGAFLAGRFAEQESDSRAAAAFLRRVLEENPDDRTLLLRTFQLTFSAGEIAEAKALARRLEAAGSRNSGALFLLAVDEAEQGRFDDALKRLNDVPKNGVAVYALPLATAWVNVGRGAVDDALAGLAPLEKQEGFQALFHLHSALINDKAGRYEAAALSYAAVAEDLVTAPLRVIRGAGSLYERMGRPEAARELYERFIADQPDSIVIQNELARLKRGGEPERLVATPVQGIAESLFNIASALPRARAGDIAMAFARLTVHLRPDFELARLLIGSILDEQERYADALEVYRAIPADSPYAWAARLRIVDDLRNLEKTEEAITLLQTMSEERPERMDALAMLGGLLRAEERYDAAAQAYQGAIERLDKVRRQDWLLFYNLGIALERSKKWDRAEASFLKALELEPDQPYVLNYLGYSWVEQGKNLAKARNMIERAVEQRQGDGYIVDSLGWVLYKLGEYEEAVQHLERAVRLRPQDPVINDHLGDAYWRVGRRLEARFQWRRSLGFEPEAELVDEILGKLERGLGESKQAGSGG